MTFSPASSALDSSRSTVAGSAFSNPISAPPNPSGLTCIPVFPNARRCIMSPSDWIDSSALHSRDQHLRDLGPRELHRRDLARSQHFAYFCAAQADSVLRTVRTGLG